MSYIWWIFILLSLNGQYVDKFFVGSLEPSCHINQCQVNCSAFPFSGSPYGFSNRVSKYLFYVDNIWYAFKKVVLKPWGAWCRFYPYGRSCEEANKSCVNVYSFPIYSSNCIRVHDWKWLDKMFLSYQRSGLMAWCSLQQHKHHN